MRWASLSVVSLALTGLLSHAPQTALAASVDLPELGQETTLLLGEERRLGNQLARELFQSPQYISDIVLEEYVASIWSSLVQAARQTGALSPDLDQAFAWRILLLRDPSINAFALPGAYFGLHLGLVALVNQPGELASVLAHEMSHVTQRHVARMLRQQDQSSNWLIMAAAIAIAAAAQKNGTLAQASVIGGQALAEQKQLNFSRDMEREADRMGWQVFEKAGFAGPDFGHMFDKLERANQLNDNGLYPYLRTHPMTQERQADITARVLSWKPATHRINGTNGTNGANGASGANIRTANTPNEWVGLCMAARAQVLLSNTVEDRDTWGRRVHHTHTEKQSAPQQAAALYGAIFSYVQNPHEADDEEAPAQALQHWQMLQRLMGSSTASASLKPYVDALEAEWVLRHPSFQPARTALKPSLAFRLDPSRASANPSRMPLVLWAQLQLQTPTPASAQAVADRLSTWFLTHPHDAQAAQILARAWDVLGQTGRSLRVQAQADLAYLNPQAALNHLLAARDALHVAANQPKGKIDFAEESVVDSLIRQTQQQITRLETAASR
jgi:predicted Zn-dependent protease